MSCKEVNNDVDDERAIYGKKICLIYAAKLQDYLIEYAVTMACKCYNFKLIRAIENCLVPI